MKSKMLTLYIGLCDRIAQISSAKRLQVGCLIVKNDNILAFGWNGTPHGWDNACEHDLPEEIDADTRTVTPAQLITKPEVLHAETNAIAKVAQGSESSTGAILFCTHAPCLDCAKLIHQSGITAVYYRDKYKSQAGLHFLEKCGIIVSQITEDTHD
jgi:dCMP deaminase